MITNDKLNKGAENLLLRCAELSSDESVVIIFEDQSLGWYNSDVVETVSKFLRKLGINPTLLKVLGPTNSKNIDVIDAVNTHDCAIFFSRIGDQDRFEVPVHGKKIIMCYIRDNRMLASPYGCCDYRAFGELKSAINRIMTSAERVDISCSRGTSISALLKKEKIEESNDVYVRRFPLGVPQPLSASKMSGDVALCNYLAPTGSKVYEPATVTIVDTVLAEIRDGVILNLSGDYDCVEKIKKHYVEIGKNFKIRNDNVHSYHAGIHPGCAYIDNASDNPDRWANTIFTNPRVLHFHTCGDYSPGEICWMVIDPTIKFDKKALWLDGVLRVTDFDETNQTLQKWPELKKLFEHPSRDIGL